MSVLGCQGRGKGREGIGFKTGQSYKALYNPAETPPTASQYHYKHKYATTAKITLAHFPSVKGVKFAPYCRLM